VMSGGGPFDSSTVLAYYMYDQAIKYYREGYSAAIAVVLFLIMLAFIVWQLRRLVRSFCTLFLRNFIRELPYELIEAARVEGASEWAIYARIVLPLVRPALAALGILVFTFIWNDYFWALCLTQGDDAAPITVGVAALRGQWTTAWNLVSAGSVLAALPSVLMFFAMQKHFVAGLTFGATKG
jgi:multiple sugar transport system permease protein